MNLLPIAASRLHRRSVALPAGVLQCGSLFPFFDRRGRVRQVLIVSVEPVAVRVAALEPKLFRTPLCKPPRLARDFHQLGRLESGGIEQLSGLWHYDPWWVLDHPWFRDLPGRSAIKATNCAPLLPAEIKEVYFARDLSRILWVKRRRSSRELAFVPWRARWLPEASPLYRSGPGKDPVRMGWELSPLWLRRTRP